MIVDDGAARVNIHTSDKLVLSTGLIMRIGHSNEIPKLTFRALAFCRSESRIVGFMWLIHRNMELRYWLMHGNVENNRIN